MSDAREKTVIKVVVACVLLVLAGLAARKAKHMLAKGPPETLVPLTTPESAVLPKRTYAAAGAGALRVTDEKLDLGGHRPRTYRLVAPASPAPGRAYPLVFVLHGDGGTSQTFHEGFPLEVASGVDALLVYPDARGGWDLETTKDNHDVAFLEALVATVSARIPVDRARVFAAGYSRGAFFANVMACQRAGFFRAISSSAGGAPYNQEERWPNGFPKCPGQAPTATLVLHGGLDFTVTMDSGRFSAQYWSYVNGCTEGEVEPAGYAECVVHRGCKPGKAVAFCAAPDLSHWMWKHAAEASWTFFRTQSDLP